MDKRVSIATITNTAAVSEAAKKKKNLFFIWWIDQLLENVNHKERISYNKELTFFLCHTRWKMLYWLSHRIAKIWCRTLTLKIEAGYRVSCRQELQLQTCFSWPSRSTPSSCLDTICKTCNKNKLFYCNIKNS